MCFCLTIWNYCLCLEYECLILWVFCDPPHVVHLKVLFLLVIGICNWLYAMLLYLGFLIVLSAITEIEFSFSMILPFVIKIGSYTVDWQLCAINLLLLWWSVCCLCCIPFPFYWPFVLLILVWKAYLNVLQQWL